MKEKKDHSFKAQLKSFSYAFNGIFHLFSTEPNAKIHLIISLLVIITGFITKLTTTEWCFILFAVALVFITELLNTAIEKMADVLSPGFDEKIGLIKDLAAGAVLIAAIIAVIVGGIVFIPKLF